MKSPLLLSIALCLASTFIAGSHAAETIVDEKYDFTLTLPEGFEPNEALAESSPEYLYGFVKANPDETQLNTLLVIERLPGMIRPHKATLDEMPPGFPGSIYVTKWRGFDVNAVVVPEQLGELKSITINVQVPIMPTAIQLKLLGPVEKETELRAMMEVLLASFAGKSNWSVAANPPKGNRAAENNGNVMLAVMIGVIVIGIVGFFILSRLAPRGTVLCLAVVLYISSFGMDGAKTREVALLIGVTRMLGFIGGILGLVDLFRRRPAKPPENQATESPAE